MSNLWCVIRGLKYDSKIHKINIWVVGSSQLSWVVRKRNQRGKKRLYVKILKHKIDFLLWVGILLLMEVTWIEMVCIFLYLILNVIFRRG